jgi:hypothetical protein
MLVTQRYKDMGATDLWLYDEPWLLQSGFVERNHWLWQHKGLKNETGGRGYGWFSWKPFIIQDALNRIGPGDEILYVDADTYPIADFSKLFELCEKEDLGILAFMATGKLGALCNRQWVKREMFRCFEVDDDLRYTAGPHAVCRFMVFRKHTLPSDERIQWAFKQSAQRQQQFLEEWQQHCLCRNCQTFDHDPAIQYQGPHGDGPLAGFREHRTEQAAYSLLCIKYGIKLHQEGRHGPQTTKGSSFRDQFPVGRL